MIMMVRARLVLCVLALFTLALVAGCGGGDETTPDQPAAGPETTAAEETGAQPAAGEPLTLRIGFSAALEGAYAPYDVPFLNGMEFAAKEINDAGGLDGVTVEIVSKNNKGDQALTITTTQELLDEGIRVFALTGADASIAQGQLITEAGGIMTLGINTAPSLGQDIGERAYYLVATDELGGSAVGEFACQQGYETAYTIGSPEIPYTAAMPAYFAESFAANCGGEVVGKDTYKIGQLEFATLVTKLQTAEPPPAVIFTPMFVPDSGAFLKALRAAGVTTPVLSTDGNDSTLFADSGGSAVDGVVFATHTFPTPGSLAEEFNTNYAQVMGEPPETNTYEGMGRDMVYILAQAADDAQSTEPDPLAQQLETLQDFEGVTGTMTMNPNTNRVTKTVTLVQMNGTTPTFLANITPKVIPDP